MENIIIWVLAIPVTGVILWILNKEAEFLYEKLRIYVISIISKVTKIEPQIDTKIIMSELNEFFKDEIKFFSIFENELPGVEIVGEYDGGLISAAEKKEESVLIDSEGKTNEPHLLVKEYNVGDC